MNYAIKILKDEKQRLLDRLSKWKYDGIANEKWEIQNPFFACLAYSNQMKKQVFIVCK